MRAADSSGRPNVLLVITDDQGYGDFSLHGNTVLQTPHLDRFARQNVRFDRFFVNAFCSPTRAALLTGRYPLRTGVWGVTHNKEAMRPSELTLAEALAAAGYRTGCFGKWHNGEQYPYTPQGQGFGEFFGFHNGHWNNYFDTELLRGARSEPTRGYIADVLTDEAIGFMRRNKEQPFFCYLAFNTPHAPIQVPDAYFQRFKSQGLDDATAGIYGMCANIDDNFGRLLAALDELHLSQRTIVLFLTDNGPNGQRFNAGLRGIKGSVHEGGCRVPLFVRWPQGRLRPLVVTEMAAHIDMYPTLLELCDVNPPAGPRIDGLSLRPLLEGRSTGWPRRLLFTHNPRDQHNKFPGAVRTPRYRAVREGQGGWQLYDMLLDPGQEQDIASQQPQVVQQLAAAYDEWFRDVSQVPLERFPIPVGFDEENPITLHAPQAYFDGQIRFFGTNGFAHDWLTHWTVPSDRVWFEIDVARPGQFQVALQYACPAMDAGARVRIAAGDTIEAVVPAAEAGEIRLPHRDGGKRHYVNRRWGTLPMGTLSLMPGRQQLTISAISMPGGQVLELKGVVLTRLGDQTP
jgi:arylsulfatase A